MSRIRMIAVTGPKAREAHTILWEGEEGSRPDHVEVPRSLGPGYIRWVRIEEERADRPLDERSVLWRGSSWRAHLAGKDDPAYWFYSPDGHHWIPASESDLTEVHHELGRRLLAERREQEKLDDHNDQMEGEAELRRLPEEELGDLVYRVGSLEQRLLLVEGQASHVDHREAADYEATRKTLDLIVGWLKEFRASGFQPNPPAELFGEAGPTQGGVRPTPDNLVALWDLWGPEGELRKRLTEADLGGNPSTEWLRWFRSELLALPDELKEEVK